MATHKSAVKRIRQNNKKRAHNKTLRSRLATLRKNVLSASTKKDAESWVKKAVSAFSKAGRQRLIHPKTASRRVSQLVRHVNSLS